MERRCDWRGLSVGLTVLLCFSWIGGSAVAQSATGSLLGTVMDQTGGVLPGATVTIIDEGTGVARTLTTDAAGTYELPLLPPGEYRVEAEFPGFKRGVRSGIGLQVNQRAVILLVLEVGSTAEEVLVIADAPLVESRSAGIGTVVDSAKVLELPLNGRDFFQLVTLVPGAVPAAEGSQNSSAGGAVSINGAREQSNSFLLDGVDNNEIGINQIVVPPPVDAVREFKVQSSTYAAEFGRSGGGQFNFVTRSGTNAFHGGAYEFVRNAALDGKNFFDDKTRETPQFQRHQYGATLGGPVSRGRLFFFGNFEGQRIRQTFTRIAIVPPLAWRNGDFSRLLTGRLNPATGLDAGQLVDPRTGLPLPGNIIPPALRDAAGAAILGFYPAPDDPAAGGPTDARVSPRGWTDVDQLALRIDQIVSARSQLFYRYNVRNHDRFNPFDPLFDPTNVPGFGSINDDRTQSLAVGWTRSIGSRAFNDFRFGFSRYRAGLFQENRGRDVAGELGITGLLTGANDVGRPGIVVGITDALLDPITLPQERRTTTLQFVDAFTWQRRGHSFKAGVDLRQVLLDFYIDVMARGNFTFVGLSGNPIADLLMGVPFAAVRQNPATNGRAGLRTTAVNGYFQDDVTVAPRLTLNLGVRYEYNRPPIEIENRFSVADLRNPAGGFLRVGTAGIPRAGFDADRNNIAPRLGAAWAATADGRTVVRGGYGIFYDVGILNLNVLPRLNPPQFGLDLFLGPRPLRNAFSGPAFPVPVLNGIDRDYRDAYYHHYSGGVQRELQRHLLLEVAYVGSAGRRLPLFLDTNQGPPGGPPVLNPAFGPAQIAFSAGRSRYDSLQVRLERRFVEGLSLLSAYTWSRSRDTGSALFGAKAGNDVPQNSRDLEGEWGPSDFDTPHRYVLSWIWQLPVGRGHRLLNSSGIASALLGNWELTGIATFQSGRPFSVFYGPTANYSGTSNGANGGPGRDRPNQVRDSTLKNPGPERWFDAAAFVPPRGAFGTVRRNTLRADGLNNFDLAAYRNLSFDRLTAQFRVEVFNAFNTPYFALPIADLTNANAGKVVKAGDARQIQLGLRIAF